jgi:hypothetical protein
MRRNPAPESRIRAYLRRNPAPEAALPSRRKKKRRMAGSRTGGRRKPNAGFRPHRTKCPLFWFAAHALRKPKSPQGFSFVPRVCEANSVARRRCAAVFSRNSDVPREGNAKLGRLVAAERYLPDSVLRMLSIEGTGAARRRQRATGYCQNL